MIVLKFGGTSVGSSNALNHVVEIVKAANKPVVVVSAFSKMTDALLTCITRNYAKPYQAIVDRHKNMLKDLNLDETLVDFLLTELKDVLEQQEGRDEKQLQDEVVSFGERLSSIIIAEYFRQNNINAKAYNAYDIGFITDNNFTEAHPLPSSLTAIRKTLKNLDHIPVITGFIAKDNQGNITTLGRGGSDFSAAFIGKAINAEEIQIWTDVNGMLSADPKIVKNPQLIHKLSFTESGELAYFGAKVLHPKTIKSAIDRNIPVRVLNTFEPQQEGTLITKESTFSSVAIKAMTAKKNVTIVNICSSRMLFAYGFLAKIFSVFAKYKMSIDIVATSELSVSMSIEANEKLEELQTELAHLGTVTLFPHKAIICLVGEDIKNDITLFGEVFSTLAKHNIPVDLISQGASKVNLTFVVDNEHADKAVQILHAHFIEGKR